MQGILSLPQNIKCILAVSCSGFDILGKLSRGQVNTNMFTYR